MSVVMMKNTGATLAAKQWYAELADKGLASAILRKILQADDNDVLDIVKQAREEFPIRDRGPHCFYCQDYGICEHNRDTVMKVPYGV